MSGVEQAFSGADPTLRLVEHQKIWLTNTVLKKNDQNDTYNNDNGSNAQRNIHDPYLLGNALVLFRLPGQAGNSTSPNTRPE
jgi:hypothetical protein